MQVDVTQVETASRFLMREVACYRHIVAPSPDGVRLTLRFAGRPTSLAAGAAHCTRLDGIEVSLCSPDGATEYTRSGYQAMGGLLDARAVDPDSTRSGFEFSLHLSNAALDAMDRAVDASGNVRLELRATFTVRVFDLIKMGDRTLSVARAEPLPTGMTARVTLTAAEWADLLREGEWRRTHWLRAITAGHGVPPSLIDAGHELEQAIESLSRRNWSGAAVRARRVAELLDSHFESAPWSRTANQNDRKSLSVLQRTDLVDAAVHLLASSSVHPTETTANGVPGLAEWDEPAARTVVNAAALVYEAARLRLSDRSGRGVSARRGPSLFLAE